MENTLKFPDIIPMLITVELTPTNQSCVQICSYKYAALDKHYISLFIQNTVLSFVYSWAVYPSDVQRIHQFQKCKDINFSEWLHIMLDVFVGTMFFFQELNLAGVERIPQRPYLENIVLLNQSARLHGCEYYFVLE